jgi:hypothetical protein
LPSLVDGKLPPKLANYRDGQILANPRGRERLSAADISPFRLSCSPMQERQQRPDSQVPPPGDTITQVAVSRSSAPETPNRTLLALRSTFQFASGFASSWQDNYLRSPFTQTAHAYVFTRTESLAVPGGGGDGCGGGVKKEEEVAKELEPLDLTDATRFSYSRG